MSGACGDCAHWGHPRDDWMTVATAERAAVLVDRKAAYEKAERVDQEYGQCNGVPMGPVDADDPPLATVLDGSLYKAILFTRAGFGCALWKAKP